MPKFRFTALDPTGKSLSGSVDSDSRDGAIALLESKGLQVESVAEAAALNKAGGPPAAKKAPAPRRGSSTPAAASAGGAKQAMNFSFGTKRVKQKDLVQITRQLSTLISAGLPLVRSIQVLQKQEKHPGLKLALDQMEESISSGSTFAEALGQHPRIFDRLYVNMVRAGELGGVLDKVLKSLSEFMEKVQKIKGKVKAALTYPVIVLSMALAIMFFLMTFIVPKFKAIFDDILAGKPLPAITEVVMAISNGMVNHFWAVIGGVVVLVGVFVALARTEKGQRVLDRVKLNNPLFGPLVRKTAIARFSRTLGTLMESGVPILQALTIVGETAGNSVISDGVKVVHDAVKEGENIAPPMEATGVFPPMVISMVEVGEETGDLPSMLNRIANDYDEEVDNAVTALTSVIEPIMIVLLAVIVGTIVLAIFLPMVELLKGFS
jgi:type IV pilus assembly protein PilC